MQLYTESQMIQAFIFGILYGLMFAWAGVTVAGMAGRRRKPLAKVIPLKSKIPTAGTSEYQMIKHEVFSSQK